jgi:hypothetical protein
MENTFFLPVGRHVKIYTTNCDVIEGVLKGVINFGGIPAIWVNGVTAENDVVVEHICLLNNVCAMTVIKEIEQSKTKTLILQP